ncbi:MAG: aspartate/glutamate racemase family protein, partial [Candidatus Saccharimonadales bacterium]
MIKVGVFDSGIGGQSVANAISKARPDIEVTFVDDSKNVPYGTKSPDELYGLVLPILTDLAKTASVIVVACNTVSTTLIGRLREVIEVPLIAVEPMVKPAAEQTKSGIIAVCATPTTLASARYNWLKQKYAANIKVLEPDCSDWSAMIEADKIDRDKIAQRIEAVCQAGADMIVLGCTHYHWIEDLIMDLAQGRARIIQPESAIVTR